MSSILAVAKCAMVSIALIWLAGCVQTKTTPGYARAGDHIVIGLGGAVRNAGGTASLKASDLVITLRDFSNQQFQLEPRFIFKSYADHSAQINTFSMDGTNVQAGLTGMVPYDGGWFVVAPLTYPAQYASPLPLAVGAATISVTSPKLINTANSIEGNLSAIPIEIIAGVSAQDVDFVRQFIGYVNTPNSFLVRPNSLIGVNDVGGAFLAIEYSDDTFFKNGVMPVVVPSDHNPYAQTSYHIVPNGDGSGTIYVTMVNPAGFKTVATATPNASRLSDLTVRLNYFSNGTPAQAKTRFSLNTMKSHYFDLNGATMGSTYPVLTHASDL
ncbi:MAG: hypothetical protein KDI09_02515 [Halioglobus sp.]|nr:hypothetical protein [Halioglobus sp.]